MPIERFPLAPGLSISRVITGLWQVADMERDGRALDPAATAPAMAPYADAGLTTFDMADHYGSAEIIAGTFHKTNPNCELLTKWVPKPGPVTREQVRSAVMRACERLQVDRIDRGILLRQLRSRSPRDWHHCRGIVDTPHAVRDAHEHYSRIANITQ